MTELDAAHERLMNARAGLVDTLLECELVRRNVPRTSDALALLDRDMLVFDEDGRPLNVQQATDELLAKFPGLLEPVPTPSRVFGCTGPVRGLARMERAVANSFQRDRMLGRLGR